MRNFTKLEKDFIKYLVESERYKRKIPIYMEKLLIGSLLEINRDTSEANLLLEIQKADFDKSVDLALDTVEEIEETIAVLVSLVGYLEQNGYIALYEQTPGAFKSTWHYGTGDINSITITNPISDNEIVKLLIKYMFRELVPLETLKELVKNKFCSTEEIRFNKQYRISMFGISIAVIIGVSSIVFNNKLLNQRATLEKHSQDSMLYELEEIHNALNKLATYNAETIKQIYTSSTSITKSINEIRSLNHTVKSQNEEAHYKDLKQDTEQHAPLN